MKKSMLFGVLCIIAGSLAVNTASAQLAWTPEQKAVWKTETTIVDLWMKGDNTASLAYYDDSYQGWPNAVPIPVPKENMEIRMNYMVSQGGKLLYWNAIPMVIWVKGDFAYTDYYYQAIWQDKDGKKTNERGKWLDILMKKNGTWVLVGDHGGEDPAPAK